MRKKIVSNSNGVNFNLDTLFFDDVFIVGFKLQRSKF